MGTNYYVETITGKQGEHLGKHSFGWKFLCKADMDWPQFEALRFWLDRVTHAYGIVDEYGTALTKAELIELVFDTMSDPGSIDHTAYILENYPSYASQGRDFNCMNVNFTTHEFC